MERIKEWLATRVAQAAIVALLSLVVAVPIVAEALGPARLACLAAADGRLIAVDPPRTLAPSASR